MKKTAVFGTCFGPKPQIPLETGRSPPNAQTLFYFPEDRHKLGSVHHNTVKPKCLRFSGYCENKFTIALQYPTQYHNDIFKGSLGELLQGKRHELSFLD